MNGNPMQMIMQMFSQGQNPMQIVSQMKNGGMNPQVVMQQLQNIAMQNPRAKDAFDKYNAVVNQGKQNGMSMEQIVNQYMQQNNIKF